MKKLSSNAVMSIVVGDHHDPKYDQFEIQSSMFDLYSYRLEQTVNSGIPLDRTGCAFTLSVYPSDTLSAGKCHLSLVVLIMYACISQCILTCCSM